ncbi:hypothetical protein LINGRAHAP2_LOCUS7089 [Linum grandiflorum]
MCMKEVPSSNSLAPAVVLL